MGILLLAKIKNYFNILYFIIYTFITLLTIHVEIKEIYLFEKKQNRNLIQDLNVIQRKCNKYLQILKKYHFLKMVH